MAKFLAIDGESDPATVTTQLKSLGVGVAAPADGIWVGASGKLRIDVNGNVVRINDVPTSWPAIQGTAGQALINDGLGALTWTSVPTGTGTTGYIPKWTSASAQGDSILRESGGSLICQNASDSVTAYQFQNAAGTTILNVNTLNGRVGIGTTAPAYMVHAKGSATDVDIAAEGALTTGNTSIIAYQNEGGGNYADTRFRAFGSANAGVSFGQSEGKASALTSYFAGSFASGGKMLIGTYSSNPLILGTNNTESMRLHATTSNVSIGTTSDLGALAVDNGATAESILVLRDNGNTVFTVGDSGTVTAKNFSDSTTAYQFQNAAGTTILNVDTTNGRVGVGTTTPGHKATIVAGTLSSGVRALEVTATLPSGLTGYGVNSTITTNGAGGSQYGQVVTLAPGGTSTGAYLAFAASNEALGGGTWDPFDGADTVAGANLGAFGQTFPASDNAATNVGAYGRAVRGTYSIGVVGTTGSSASANNAYKQDSTNAGVIGTATLTKHASSTTEKHAGVVGLALGGDTNVGGYFGLQAGAPTFASAALLADNGATSSPILLARDNGNTVFTVGDSGTVTAKNFSNSTTAYQFQNAAGTTVLNVDTTNGRVGIGTTAPTDPFHVRKDQNAQTGIVIENQTSGTSATTSLIAQGSASGEYAGVTYASAGYTGISALADSAVFYGGSTTSKAQFGSYGGTVVFFTNLFPYVEAARFHPSANFSIGTTSDLAQLAVDNGSDAESIMVLRDNGSTVVTVADGGDTTITEQLGVGVAPTEKLSVKDHSAFTGSAAQLTTGAVQTTDATQTPCKTLTLADNTLYWLEADVIGRDTGGTDRAYYKLASLVYRQGGVATLGTVNVIVEDETNAAWDATLTVSSNDVRVSITGAGGTTVNWVCAIRYQAVSGNS